MDDYVSLAKTVLDDMTYFCDNSDHPIVSTNSIDTFVDYDPGKRVTILHMKIILVDMVPKKLKTVIDV